MKVSIDDVELFSISEIQKKIIAHVIPSEILDADLKRRIQWIITHLHDEIFKDVKKEWLPIISQRYSSIPTDESQLAELITSQPDYKNRSQRDQETEAKKAQLEAVRKKAENKG